MLPSEITRLGDSLEFRYDASPDAGAALVRIRLIPTARGTTLQIEDAVGGAVSPPTADPRPWLVVLVSLALLRFFWRLPTPWLVGTGLSICAVAYQMLKVDQAIPALSPCERAAHLLRETLHISVPAVEDPSRPTPS